METGGERGTAVREWVPGPREALPWGPVSEEEMSDGFSG